MQAAQNRTRDTVVASATVQRTPRVSIVLSSYKGGGDHFGNATFTGVPEPQATAAQLNDAQVKALARRAVDLGNHPNRGLRRVVARGETVALLVNRDTDPGVVSAVIEAVKETAEDTRITIISDAANRFTGGTLVDVSTAESMKMPAPGIWSRKEVTYRVPRALIDCDKLISIAPLRVQAGRPSLSIDNYRLLIAGQPLGATTPDLAAIDLYGFHPADYSVVGGTQVLRNGAKVRHNVVMAGAVPLGVDLVGASILGLKPTAIPLFKMAGERYGKTDVNEIWTIGNEIEDARLQS